MLYVKRCKHNERIMSRIVQKRTKLKKICPECGAKIALVWTENLQDGAPKFIERLYHCYSCGASWITKEIDGEETNLQRYFFG